MLVKRPARRPPIVGRILGALFIVEAVGFGAGYFLWNKCNKSRDFREKVKESAPWALEWYYKFGETISEKNKVIRQHDEETWAARRLAQSKTA